MTRSTLTLKIRVDNGGSLRETEKRERPRRSVLKKRKSAADRKTICLLYELLDKTARDFLAIIHKKQDPAKNP